MSCPKVIKVVTPGPPGPPGGAISMTGPAVLGRESGTGAPGPISIGAGLEIVGGALRATGGGGSGSVTQVGLSMPTGFSVTGSPITSTGTLAVAFAIGYSLPTTAKQADWDTAAGLAATAIQPGNAALTNAREWIAETVTQAEAEAGTAETRRAWNALRVRQAIAAWWLTASTAAGRAMASAVDAAAQRTLLGLGVADSPSFTGLTITGTSPVVIPHIHGDLAGSLYLHVKNVGGTQLAKGTPVCIAGAVGDTSTLEVIAADASDSARMPAAGLLGDTLAANASGHMVNGGELLGAATGGFLANDELFVAVGGGITATRPTSGIVQSVGSVGRAHASTGSIAVSIGPGLVPVAYSGAYGDLSGRPTVPSPADQAPSALGTPAIGSSTDYAREDHRHQMPSAADVGADPAGTAASAMASHLAEANPHPGYLTPSEVVAGSGISVDLATTPGSAIISATGKTVAPFEARQGHPPAANFATVDTRNIVFVLEFDSTTEESTVFLGLIPQGTILTSGLLVRIWWMADTATTGNVRWAAQFERSGTDLDADSFDSLTEVTSAAPATSGIEAVAEITCTALDGLTAGDGFRLRIVRRAADATNDTMSGDAQLVRVEVRQVA